MFTFKTDVYRVMKKGNKFPVGTPKMIKELEELDEVILELKAGRNSSKADDVTLTNLTKGTSHTMKKGHLFKALADVALLKK